MEVNTADSNVNHEQLQTPEEHNDRRLFLQQTDNGLYSSLLPV